MSKILTEVLSANESYVSSFGAKANLTLPPARGFASTPPNTPASPK